MSELLKRQAALAALDEVRSGMVVGLGTGSTARHFIIELGARVRAGLEVSAVATSLESAGLAEENGIRMTSFAVHKVLDLAVDGADEVSPELDLVKGLGGALVREKIVAKASRRFVIVVDETKLVDRLGTRAPIPVETVPFAAELVAEALERLGGRPELRSVDGAAFVSDNGNNIIDWHSGPVPDPAGTERRLKEIVGVVDSGIFSSVADRVIVAGEGGIRSLDRNRRE